MPTPARVVVLPKDPGPLAVVELKLPDPGPDQVVVKQYASGVCHSQLHQMHAKREYPVLLGHESTGVVVAAGNNVGHVREGDTVLVTWVPRNAGAATALPPAAALEVPGFGAARSQNVFTWADHTIADQQYVVHVRPDIDRYVTSIIGCAVITGAGAVLHTAKVARGDSVAIFGAGGVGLSAVAAAKRLGADPIIAVDLDDRKLEFARAFGASHGVNASRVDAVAAIHELVRRERGFDILGRPITGVDYAFDCIGIKKTMEQIVPAVRPCHFGGVDHGGVAVLVGVPTTPVELSAIEVLLFEKQFRGSIGGSCSPDRDFPRFLDWFADGSLPLDRLVTERYRLDQINEATAALAGGKIFGRAILEIG